jgi:hypothetical protein
MSGRQNCARALTMPSSRGPACGLADPRPFRGHRALPRTPPVCGWGSGRAAPARPCRR